SGDTSDSESDDIRAIMDYLEPLCCNPSLKTASKLRALCMRSLVIREFLSPFVHTNAKGLQKFPNHLKPLCRIIRVWRTTEVGHWSRSFSTFPTYTHQLPSDEGMWTDIQCDGPLINLAVLACSVL